MRIVGFTVWLLACLATLALSRAASAQDLEPRAYSQSPTGANFLVMGFGEIDGSVLFDPSLPITGVHAQLYSSVAGLGHTFGLFGRQALVTAALPYVWGNMTGQVFEQQHNITRSGLADTRFKFSLNLHGSPALSPQEFVKSRRRSLIVGASLSVTAPSGQYDPTKLVNLGTNRWGFKPELGVSYPRKRWYFDLYSGVWFFTENSSFYPGQSTRRQAPLPSLQAHVSYTVRPRLWAAFDSTWYAGGASRVDNGPPTGRLNNSRVGATLSIPIGKSQSLKIAYSAGATARSGANFSSIGVAWQFLWFDRRGLPIP
ncbi:MAG TPA: transporter [Terriglobia bacterium]|nr:transporter [Terriglobia bacterium]